MQSAKMEHMLNKLFSEHLPFNLLSAPRLAELADVVRVFEMREGEIFQLKPSAGHDYLCLIEGQIGIIADGGVQNIVPQSTRKRVITLQGPSAQTILVASADSIACLADGAQLDDLVSWDGMVRLTEVTDVELHKLLARVRNSRAFRRMPLECVEAAFKAMRPLEVKKGEKVVRQGEEGDSFYIMTSGKAELWETGLYDDGPSKVADLHVGDTFGGEALLTGKKGNETVRIIEDATLLVLGKQDFDQLIGKELVRRIHPKVAKSMLETGYKALDVRYKEEYDEHHIPDSILIPLPELNQRMGELDKNQSYIVYCRVGNRSAVAALKLTQNNFDAASLDGGITAWPYQKNQRTAAA